MVRMGSRVRSCLPRRRCRLLPVSWAHFYNIRVYFIAGQSLRRLFFTQACLSRAWFKYPIEVRTRVPGLVKVSKARHAEWHEHAPIVGCCTSFYCCGHK